MAPVRRYVRVSRWTVLEVRIHMDNPADTARWLLHPRTPALGRVMEAVRPLIVPKLREENERVRKGKKKQPVRDVVVRDDFEVTVLFTEGGTSHSLLKRHKTFAPKSQTKTKMKTKAKQHEDDSDAEGDGQIGTGTQDVPVELNDEDDEDDDQDPPVLVREESDEEPPDVKLEDIPSHADAAAMDNAGATAESPAAVSDDSQPEEDADHTAPLAGTVAAVADDKKKMGMTATYQGFRIHGYTLYLVVKRKDNASTAAGDGEAGHSLMEGWIASTQTVPPVADD